MYSTSRQTGNKINNFIYPLQDKYEVIKINNSFSYNQRNKKKYDIYNLYSLCPFDFFTVFLHCSKRILRHI